MEAQLTSLLGAWLAGRGLGQEGALWVPNSASCDPADPRRDVCFRRGLFGESLMGFISPLPVFRMQLMWAGVTSQLQQREEIQRNELPCGVSLGETCAGSRQASPWRCFLLSQLEPKQPGLGCCAPRVRPGTGHPEFAGSPQEQGARLCARRSRLREMRRC